MLSRRDLLMGVPVVARLRPADAQAARQLNAGDLNEITGAIRSLQHLSTSADVAQIRERQRTHFKVNQKFPNYIDVGVAVWERMTTWHLENHLPLTATRTPDGRMEMEFMLTTLVLKWDMGDGFIGVPYD
jgi:hypothetical protein